MTKQSPGCVNEIFTQPGLLGDSLSEEKNVAL